MMPPAEMSGWSPKPGVDPTDIIVPPLGIDASFGSSSEETLSPK